MRIKSPHEGIKQIKIMSHIFADYPTLQFKKPFRFNPSTIRVCICQGVNFSTFKGVEK